MEPDLDDTVWHTPGGVLEAVREDLDDTWSMPRPRLVALADLVLMPGLIAVPDLVEPPAPTPRRAPTPRSSVPAVPVRTSSVPVADSTTAPDDPTPLPHRLRMADGVIVKLDLTVYLGRDPSVPRIASDRRVRLVAVPSFDKQVSATHLEVRVAGDTVVATDMLSTNGSIVTVPGSAPRTLLRGESAVVTPGTLIDLGDGNVIEVLGPDLGQARA